MTPNPELAQKSKITNFGASRLPIPRHYKMYPD
jgi:hypothetical protein